MLPITAGTMGLHLKPIPISHLRYGVIPTCWITDSWKNYILTGGGKRKDTHDPEFYNVLGEALTQREIITDTAERESVKMKTAEFMKNYLGDEFDGTITGVIPIGFFVELDDFFVEGLVHVSGLDDDYYNLDSSGIQLVGRRSKRTYRVGDRVRVIVSAASKEKAEVDFMLVRPLKKKTAAKKSAKIT